MRSTVSTLFKNMSAMPKVVIKNNASTTTYQLNTDCEIRIKHKPIRTVDDLLMTMIGQPLVARLALAIAHQSVIPANSSVLHDIFDVADLAALHTSKKADHINFAALFTEMSKIRFDLLRQAYSENRSVVRNKV